MMMNLADYALDVNKSIDEIKALCDKLSIAYEDENTELSDEDIILLDNEINSSTEEEEEEVEETEEEQVYDKAVELAEETNIDLDEDNSIKKVKKRPAKNKENTKEFLKQKKSLYKHREKLQSNEKKDDENIIVYNSKMTVADLANKLGVNANEIIKKLIGLGVMANQNQTIDFDTAEIVVTDYNKTLKKEESVDISDFENFEIEEDEKNLVERAPVVTIMGHVDHGKTTLLDTIRKTSVAEGEAGGITQAIGAYSVKCDDKDITFIDTPGHAAFTAMRARGASCTDIIVIIIAADDGIMPQTVEAIDHAKAAKVPIIVAINKIDKEGAAKNIDKIMGDLSNNGLTPEEWGGDVIVNKISAKKGDGVKELLENILLVASMSELKANPNRYASGVVIESKKDKTTGCVATLLIQNGTLRLGDPIVVGTSYGKVRTLKNDKGENIATAAPSTPVEITGLSEVPAAGDKFMAFETEKQGKAIAEERKIRAKEEDSNFSGMSLEELFGKIKEGIKEINVIIKADVNGSSEAVKSALEKIDIDGVKVNVVRSAVGAITESDVVLAQASQAMIIGFNVRANAKTMDIAKEYGVSIKNYDIIYKLVEDMEDAMKGMLDPEYEEKVVGNLEIRQLFKFSKVGLIAGCHVTEGYVKNTSLARIIRDDIVVYTGKVNTLQKGQDEAKEAKKGMDCGITLENCQDYKVGDNIEIYELVEIKR
ncbi:MAG: translation initiation factor IF-2 [Bacilli bacterium]|nr:translation initiation factor IF-2 [Bacilli bacterium]